MRILGLDEAGRGAVLGPLVVGAFCVEAARLPALEAAGATDSKRLSPARRRAVAAALADLGEGAVEVLPARRIDGANLNRLEEELFVALVRRFRPDVAILDAPCHPAAIPAVRARLGAAVGDGTRWVIEPRADRNHLPCGAASILAKVERDRRVDALGPVGSGYPSDPTTRAWLLDRLREGGPLPGFVRTRWATVRRLAAGLAQVTLE